MVSYNVILIFVLIVSLICINLCSGQGRCIGQSPCHCTFENGQYLKLDDLARLDGIPRFVNISDTHEISYSWNPCVNFTEGGCEDVAICGIEPSFPHDLYLDLGHQDMTQFETNLTDNSVTLVYKTSTKPYRTSYISLKCINASGQEYFKAMGPKQQTSTEYYFELRSPSACPQGTPMTSTTGKPTSSRNQLEAPLIIVSCLAFIFTLAFFVVILKWRIQICHRSYKSIND